MMKQVNGIDFNCWGTRAVLAVVLVLATGMVSAQDQDKSRGQGNALEEIVVTAEFRSANVQETPLAVTAVTADMLEARSQTNLAQITAQAPNVSLRPAGSAFGNALVAFIRGVGQTDFNPSVEPGVGIYVDDVYYGTITGNVLDLLDLDRVEVLRGPQGTLAGRNSIGGAIKLFTRKPDGSNDGFIEATYGKYDRTEFKGAAGLTIIPDTLFARIAGTSKNSDGYITRYDYACVNGLPPPGTAGGLPTYVPSFGCELGKEGGQSYTSGRIAVRWAVNDKIDFNVAASIVNDHSESQPGVLVAAKDNSGSNFPWYSPNGPAFGADPFTCIAAGVVEPWADCALNNPTFSPFSGSTVPIYYDNGVTASGGTVGVYDPGIDVPFDSRFVTGGTYANYSTYINDGKSTPSPLFQGGVPGANEALYKPDVSPPINHLKAWDVSTNLSWQLSDNASLLYVFAYREYSNYFSEDTDGSPLAVQQLLQVLKHNQMTHELRLNATLFDGLADITLGGFYLDQKTNEDARVDLPYVGFDFIHGPDLVPSKNKSVYGHVTLHPMDRVDLSAGLRYSKDEKSYTFHRHNPDLSAVQPCTTFWFWEAANPTNCGVYGLDGLSVKYSSDRLDWRTALSYDYTDDVMLYVQVASGYKAGGNNARPFFPSQSHAFDPEELISYEAGIKSTWADQLRLNISAFWNDYTAIQLPTTSCTWAPVGQQTPCASQNNVGDAEVWGVELEGEWHPTEAISIDASYSHLDFKYTKIAILPDGSPASAVTLDMISPYTPENKWSIGAQYEMQLPNELGTLTPRIDANWQDDIYADANNRPTNFIPDYMLVNARLTWRSVDDNWQISAEATNLTNKYYYVTLFDLWDANGYVHGQPGRPIEWAISVKRRF